jgi:outer membrane protein assembly factor BamB
MVGNEIYLITTRGVASCIDARTGEVNWVERLGGDFWASPTFADGKIYILGASGKSYTLAPGKQYKLLAESQLDGRQMASPAMCGSAIYLRTHTHLYRIEKPDRRSAQR